MREYGWAAGRLLSELHVAPHGRRMRRNVRRGVDELKPVVGHRPQADRTVATTEPRDVVLRHMGQRLISFLAHATHSW